MEREFEQADQAQPEEIEAVAERLQQLSSEEIERVLHRAVELQTEKETARPALFDATALRNVANELGIDSGHLQAAMVEEMIRLETDEPNWLDRLVAPDRIAAWGTIDGDRTAIRQVLDQWMSALEGLTKISDSATGARWAKDGRFATSLKMALGGTRSDGSLRSAASVRDSVRPISEQRSLVTVEADTSNLRQLAIGFLVGGAAVGVAAAGLSDVLDASGFGAGNVAAGVGAFGLVAGSAWIGVRMWAGKIKRALEKVVGVVANPPRSADTKPVWGVLDSIVGLADEVRSAFRFRR